ncbi:hypothetical protein BV898_12089 [Hypsibius exemplaris]|uniref:Uncharacterized protein n=1 Tax=Hypsibius exemplaris TaxID=2072580 RepID=A0A1W0WEQ8_HYPEX|nr:hypothetical protein BV898_12089 [Hypsibius exemplaris]
MADHFILIIVALFRLTLGTDFVRSQSVPINQLCHHLTDPDFARCTGGKWPSQPMDFPSNIDHIRFWDIVFQSDDTSNVQPLPATLTSLKQLAFYPNVTWLNHDGEVVRSIPLQKLTENVNRTNIASLLFMKTRFLLINEQFLAGFTGLESLMFIECDIAVIVASAFESLITLTTNHGNEVSEASSALKRFVLFRTTRLKRFPWNVLTYVSSSLEEVKIDENSDLTAITFTRISPGNVTYTPMKRLETVSITNNPYLSALPEAILTRGNGTGIIGAGNGTSSISFAGNGNQCDGCALKSLIAWAAELSNEATELSRYLWADCRVDCEDTLFGNVPHTAGWPIGLKNATFWAELQAQQPPNCNALVIKPCADEYDPPTTIASPSTPFVPTAAGQESTPFFPTDGGPKPSVPSSTARTPSGSRRLFCLLAILLLLQSLA